MGQVDDQVIFALLGLPGHIGGAQGLLPQQIQFVLRRLQVGGQADGLFAGRCQLPCGLQQFVGAAQGPAHEPPGHPQPHRQQAADPHQQEVILDPAQQLIIRLPALPDAAGARPPGQQRQCAKDGGGEKQRREHPALQLAADAAFSLFIQRCSPPPTQS